MPGKLLSDFTSSPRSGLAHPGRCNCRTSGKHTPGIRTDKVALLQLVGIGVVNVAEATLGKERPDLTLVDPEKNPLTERPGDPRSPLEHFGFGAAWVVQGLVVEVVKDHGAARRRMVGDKRQRTVNAFRCKVRGYALPDEQRFAVLVVTAGEQTFDEHLVLKSTATNVT